MASNSFTDAAQNAGNDLPHKGFGLVLGKMLREFDEISADDYDLVGQVQARTVVLAEIAQSGTPEQREAVISQYGGQDWKTKEPTGKLDLNSAMFSLKKTSAVAELDTFLKDLNIEDLDPLMDSAVETVHQEKGVHPDAAASAVILKSLVLDDYNRDEKQAIVDASLIMQMATRAMDRLSAFENGEYDREKGLALMNTSNKLNYKFDPPALIQTNEALLFICNVEMSVGSALNNAETPDMEDQIMRTQRQMYETALRVHTESILNAMPEAAKLYRSVGKEDLAQRAEEVQEHFENHYAHITRPNLMNTPRPDTSSDASEDLGM